MMTQLSHYKRAERNLLTDEKGPQQGNPGSCLVIHLDLKYILTIFYKYSYLMDPFQINNMKQIRGPLNNYQQTIKFNFTE